MKIAIQGCSHGELDSIYASLLRTEREESIQIDALLLCGDFQAIRNHADLHALAVPAKYRQLGDFHSYYSGEKLAPVLTLVIGGNHEASNYMHELFHGGWLAPNIYFLGAAGVVELNGLVVAGISGIWKAPDYRKGRYEKLPYDAGSIRSAYHTREFDVLRLIAMKQEEEEEEEEEEGGGVDIVMSHDWPNTIEQWGDKEWLLKKKPYFKQEVENETLGSPPLMELLKQLKPNFWFSAHLHVKFPAIFNHDKTPAPTSNASDTTAKANPEAIDINLDSDDEPTTKQDPVACSSTNTTTTTTTTSTSTENGTRAEIKTTRFLALHKCLPLTPFLQILDIPSPHDTQLNSGKLATNNTQRILPTLRYNKRWLAITRAYHPYFSLSSYRQPPLPPPHSSEMSAKVEQEIRWIDQNLFSPTRNSGKRKQDELEGSYDSQSQTEADGDENEEEGEGVLDVGRVQTFVRTAPSPFEPGGMHQGQPNWYTNPQTEAFCRFVGVENKINPQPQGFTQLPFQHHKESREGAYRHPHSQLPEVGDPNALVIDIDDLDETAAETPEIEEERGGRVVTLSEDEDELHARWKEGTG